MIYAHICAICMSAYRCIYICILIVSSIWMNEQIPPEAHDRFCGYCRLSGMRALINMLIYIYISCLRSRTDLGVAVHSQLLIANRLPCRIRRCLLAKQNNLDQLGAIRRHPTQHRSATCFILGHTEGRGLKSNHRRSISPLGSHLLAAALLFLKK